MEILGSNPCKTDYFIGLNFKNDKEGLVKWSDNSPMVFTAWDPNEHRNYEKD